MDEFNLSNMNQEHTFLSQKKALLEVECALILEQKGSQCSQQLSVSLAIIVI